MKQSKLVVRGLEHHIQEWCTPGKPMLVMLHGWMDCGATYKFMAEHLQDDYHLIAPDWRGFGETDRALGYWFADYFADLEVILNHFSPQAPCNLVGHSMGGNIALIYAGIRPERVAKVMSLEALGLPPSEPAEAPDKYRRWLREILSDEPAKVYPNLQSLQYSVHKGNPSLSRELVEQVADLWGKPVGDDGAMMLKHDHAHRYTNPVRYSFDDTLECWKQITAQVGAVMAANSVFYQRYSQYGRIDQAREVLRIREQDYFVVNDSGHMMHIEQAAATAECVKAFF